MQAGTVFRSWTSGSEGLHPEGGVSWLLLPVPLRSRSGGPRTRRPGVRASGELREASGGLHIPSLGLQEDTPVPKAQCRPHRVGMNSLS